MGALPQANPKQNLLHPKQTRDSSSPQAPDRRPQANLVPCLGLWGRGVLEPDNVEEKSPKLSPKIQPDSFYEMSKLIPLIIDPYSANRKKWIIWKSTNLDNKAKY